MAKRNMTSDVDEAQEVFLPRSEGDLVALATVEVDISAVDEIVDGDWRDAELFYQRTRSELKGGLVVVVGQEHGADVDVVVGRAWSVDDDGA